MGRGKPPDASKRQPLIVDQIHHFELRGEGVLGSDADLLGEAGPNLNRLLEIPRGLQDLVDPLGVGCHIRDVIEYLSGIPLNDDGGSGSNHGFRRFLAHGLPRDPTPFLSAILIQWAIYGG